ncbi:hypothetical protein E2C01_083032 [Portunus trituberculatus]|uniref:Uncharacterized protein n=1 Tax=Portunus trituberculatus TaxID=210409 RepID=A0A5B7J5B9_PORTR|nr:hypothetical protein [Portunus trituberculatus]
MVANQTSTNLLPRLNESFQWKSHGERHIGSPWKAERTKKDASRRPVKGVKRDHWSAHCSLTKTAALHRHCEPPRRHRLSARQDGRFQLLVEGAEPRPTASMLIVVQCVSRITLEELPSLSLMNKTENLTHFV